MKNPAAKKLGALGGKAKTKKKSTASRKNGKKGGRPLKHDYENIIEWVKEGYAYRVIAQELLVPVSAVNRAVKLYKQKHKALWVLKDG